MVLWLLLIGAGALAVLVARLCQQAFIRYQKVKAVPSPPIKHWLLGHPGVIDSDKAPWLLHAYAKQLGSVFRLRLAHWHLVVVSDPAEALRLLSRGDHYLDKAPEIYVDAFNMVHNDAKAYNILSWSTGAEWRAIRKATAPMFAAAHVKAALPLMLGIADSITQQWEAAGPSKVWDLNDVCKRITLDAFMGWGFDSSLNAIKDLETPNPFKDLVDGMAHAVHTVLMDPTHKIRPWSKAVRKGRMQLADYDSWMETFTQQLLERKDTLPKDCIGRALIELEDPSLGGKLSRKQLVSNVAVFMAAGYETTAISMTMTLMLLLRHPEWLQRVEAELDTAGLLKTPARRQPRTLTLADVNELPVLNAVIKESLRLLPPAPLATFRCTKVDTEIGGYTVPAGCMVTIPPFVIDNARWTYGEDAEEFNPSRWFAKGAARADQEQSGNTAPVTHLHASATSQPVAGQADVPDASRLKEPNAFSVGPRDCVGQSLARLEMQVFLAVLLSRFRLHLAPSMGTPQQALDSLVFHVTFAAENGMWVTAAAR